MNGNLEEITRRPADVLDLRLAARFTSIYLLQRIMAALG